MRIPIVVDENELFIELDTQPSFPSVQQVVSDFLYSYIPPEEMNEIILASNTFKISGFVFRELRAKGVNIFNPASTEVKNPKAQFNI